MAKIRRLGNRELRQVIDLLSKFAHDAATTQTLTRLQSLYIPFHTLNSLLPLSLKFMPEVFVASEEGRVLSLIWLSQDGHRRDCWKIDEIIINPETDSSLAVTKQLVQYSLSQLGARGVETFLAYLHQKIYALKVAGFIEELDPEIVKLTETGALLLFREKGWWGIKGKRGMYLEIDVCSRAPNSHYRIVEAVVWPAQGEMPRHELTKRARVLISYLRSYLMANDKTSPMRTAGQIHSALFES